MTDNAYWISRLERVEVIRQKRPESNYRVGDFYCRRKDGTFVDIPRKDVIQDSEYAWVNELALILVTPKPAKNPRMFELTKLLVKSEVPYAPILEKLVKRHRSAAKKEGQLQFDLDYMF